MTRKLHAASFAAACCTALALQGCSTFTTNELAKPEQLHSAAVGTGGTASPVQQKAIAAEPMVPLRYYEAMAEAAAANAAQTKIDTYTREGIAVVELYCLRWFTKLEDEQRRSQLNDTNRNVITQLGTTLIGVGRLHADVTTVYGALNAAVAGYNANISSTFLAAPNAENVKRLTMDALRSRAAQLRDPSSPMYPTTFSEAYVQLEKLANQCTHGEVKRLTNKSVDRSHPTADPVTGEIELVSAATREQALVLRPRIETMMSRISALSPANAVALVRVMPFRARANVKDILESDKDGKRFQDAAVAKRVLLAALVLSTGNEADLLVWDQRLGMLAD